ncbi:MAG: helix-turn-helix domain-containing protein [Nitrososphaerota archaeon]|nr:helix-turn-helix domain-containing protein [Nitrososphaerota archaeon]
MTVEIEKEQFPLILDDPDTILKVVSCRPHGPEGMTMFVEIISSSPVRDILDRLTGNPNIFHSSFKIFDEYRASGMITTRDSHICRLPSLEGGFCKGCPLELSSTQQTKARWRVVFADSQSSNEFLKKLAESGISAETADVGDLRENGLLTLREEQSIRLAQELGYFHFPRKTSLRKLSTMIGISPSTLDEILRRAEGKIIKGHVRNPNGNGSKKSSRI